jgi:hypothetical protein
MTYPVLKTAGWTLYSLAKTKGTIPWGKAAYACRNNIISYNKY